MSVIDEKKARIPKAVAPRHMDGLGRVVIPIHIRSALGLTEIDPLIILHDPNSDNIIIKREIKSCVLCGSTDIDMNDEAGKINEKYVCPTCRDNINHKKGYQLY